MPLRHPTSSSIAGTLVALVVGLAPAVHAQGTVMASTEVQRITTDSGGSTTPMVMTLRTVTAGGRSRIETASGTDSTRRMLMILDSAMHTMTSIVPAQHAAMVIDYPGTMMKGMFAAIPLRTVGKAEVHVEAMGDGPAILGHPTTHYHVTRHVVQHYAGSTMSCDRTTETREDRWTTLDSIGPAWAHLPLPGGLASAVDSGAVAEIRQVRGYPLRSEAVVSVRTDSATFPTVKVTTEVTQLDYAPVDTALLSTPAGYTVMDQRALMAAVDQKKMFEAMAPMMGQLYCKGRAVAVAP